MGETKKIGYLGDTKIPELAFIEKEYENRRVRRDVITSIINEIPLNPKSKSRLGSYYDFAIKHSNMYFTRSDFATAIIHGKNANISFGENTAITLLKKNFPSVWSKLSEVINTAVRSHEVVDYALKKTLSDEFKKLQEREIKNTIYVESQIKPYVERIDNLDSFILKSKGNIDLVSHIVTLIERLHNIENYLDILANGKSFNGELIFSLDDYAKIAKIDTTSEERAISEKIIGYLESNFEKFSQKSEEDLMNIMRVTELEAIERGVSKEVASKIMEINTAAKKIHEPYYKMLSLGEDRVCGAIKLSEGSISFAYNPNTGEIIADGIYSENIPNILGLDLNHDDIIKYLTPFVKTEEPFTIDFIPSKFHFYNQKTTDTLLYREDMNEVLFALIEREFPPYGLALPGGIVDPNEKSFDANLRELKEELNADNIEVIQDLGVRESLEVRGSIETRLLVVKAVNPSEVRAGDDANSFKWLTEGEISVKIEKGEVIPHHVEYIEEGLDFVRQHTQGIESVLSEKAEDNRDNKPTSIKR